MPLWSLVGQSKLEHKQKKAYLWTYFLFTFTASLEVHKLSRHSCASAGIPSKLPDNCGRWSSTRQRQKRSPPLKTRRHWDLGELLYVRFPLDMKHDPLQTVCVMIVVTYHHTPLRRLCLKNRLQFKDISTSRCKDWAFKCPPPMKALVARFLEMARLFQAHS